MEYIYVLRLVDDKYYVGKTKDVDKRFCEHLSGEGSAYTKLYPPIEIFNWKELESEHDENNMVKSLMNIFGMDNVRGGNYSKEFLTPEEKKFIERELFHNEGKCLYCGGDHFIRNCESKNKSKEEIALLIENKNLWKTVKETAKLFLLENKSLEEISEIRKFKFGTLENHIAQCIEKGLYIDFDRIGYNIENKKVVEASVQKLKSNNEEITEMNVLTKCNKKISFADIRYSLALMKKNGEL